MAVRKNETYPIARMDLVRLPRIGREPGERIRAVWDGSPRRQIRKGEWFLSGEPTEAYLAYEDGNPDFPYHAAQLVVTRQVTSYHIVSYVA